jgi:hypothetical protein
MFNNGRKVVATIYLNIHFSGPGMGMVQAAPANGGSSDDAGEGPDASDDPGGNRVLLRAILGKVEDIQQQNEAISEKISFWKRMN